VLLLVMAAALAGCVSLLPKAKPARLYRFGAAEPAAAEAQAPATARPTLGLGAVSFDAAASIDRILTVNGQGTAYIEDARWISPAPTLFREALTRTFEQTPGAPRLVERGGALRAPAAMNLDVQSFEARYDQGEGSAPLVVVKVHASIVSNQTRALQAEQVFTASVRASDNRQAPIVAAFNTATQQVLGEIAAWASKG
jgi:cholesterol transport system auxiliary component